ncbi:hypothetical protein CEE37_11950 [candidate division LCP-89 bacterium B3_LCP]|uniref:DUF362 domain-containing protein n=1 Tax=candidate division LCP-89 bacterium B3_LCP TaxID=2012998 RepID=A0A532UW15_UNCL8|nr:MAG: hypothetical protein CEE37_11950 [candidate division LCP-89 bacterium B3_LCP]
MTLVSGLCVTDKKAGNMRKPKNASPKDQNRLTRRDFLKSTSIATAAAITLPVAFGPFSIITKKAQAQPPNLNPYRVVVVKDTSAHQGSVISTDITQVMMDEAIRRYTGMLDLSDAYKILFPGINSESTIGIKVNSINTDLSTQPGVVEALVNGLQNMIVGGNPFPANNIIIWDRDTTELQAAGYTVNTGPTGVRCFGTNEVGFNTNINLYCAETIQHPSRILTDYINYHINFSVLKNAVGAGLTMALKNNYGCIDMPGDLHGNNCNPGIPAVNQQIRDELNVVESLFIVDGIFGCTSGGPMGPPNMIYDGIILGQDRVAVDSIGRTILEEYGCSTLENSVHVDTAAEPPYNLGTNNLNEIIRVDVDNPSMSVGDLRVNTADQDSVLLWSAPEYTGHFSVRRSTEPSFSAYQEIAKTQAHQYIDRRALRESRRYFYRVVKTW